MRSRERNMDVARSVYPVPQQSLAVVGPASAVDRMLTVDRMAELFNWPLLAIAETESLSWAIRINRPAAVVVLGGVDQPGVRRRVEEIRRASRCLIVAVADAAPAEVVDLLVAGADEVLPEDISAHELGARLLALVRAHVAGPDAGARFLASGVLSVDLHQQSVTLSDAVVPFSTTEFRLLVVLMESAGQVLSAARLIFDVWGWEEADGVNVLRIFISRVRRKLGQGPGPEGQWIRSARGHGYSFVPTVIAASTWEGSADAAVDELQVVQRLAEKCELLSADADAAQSADRIVASLVAEGTVDAVALHLTREGRLRLIAHRGFSAAWERAAQELQLQDPRFAASRAVTTAEPVQIVRLADRVYPGTTGLLRGEGMGTYLFFPLKARGTVVGAMGVVRRSGEPFGPISISYLQAIADLCGVCLAPSLPAMLD